MASSKPSTAHGSGAKDVRLCVVGHESDLVRNASLHSLAQDFALEGSTEITGALELRLRGGVRSRSSYRRGCPAFYALGGHLFACFQGLYYYTPLTPFGLTSWRAMRHVAGARLAVTSCVGLGVRLYPLHWHRFILG
jgi:hypothetical protein